MVHNLAYLGKSTRGIGGFFLSIIVVGHYGNKSLDKKRFEQEDAWRRYKMGIGADPTFDEYGRLRK